MAGYVTIFDVEKIGTIASDSRPAGGGARFVMTAQGINYTIVNRELLYEDGRHTALPGSGRELSLC